MPTHVSKEKSIKTGQKTVDKHCIIDASDYVSNDISVDVIASEHSNRVSIPYDPLKSRKHFWQKNFGSVPLPTEVSNASEIFAGSLGRKLNLTPSEIQSAFDEADED